MKGCFLLAKRIFTKGVNYCGVNYSKLIFILISLFIIPPICLFSQELKEMQFIDQPITDILLALGEISGKSIIPDETVKGSASYYFVETDFETAFEVFLETNKMYFEHYRIRILA